MKREMVFAALVILGGCAVQGQVLDPATRWATGSPPSPTFAVACPR